MTIDEGRTKSFTKERRKMHARGAKITIYNNPADVSQEIWDIASGFVDDSGNWLGSGDSESNAGSGNTGNEDIQGIVKGGCVFQSIARLTGHSVKKIQEKYTEYFITTRYTDPSQYAEIVMAQEVNLKYISYIIKTVIK